MELHHGKPGETEGGEGGGQNRAGMEFTDVSEPHNRRGRDGRVSGG